MRLSSSLCSGNYQSFYTYSNTSSSNKDSMYREILFRTLRFIVDILKSCVLFLFLGRDGRHKTTGYKISFASFLINLTYDYACKLFSLKESEREETYTQPGCERVSETEIKDGENKEKVHPFKIHVPPDILADLNCRLKRTRLEEPYQGSAFQNGTNSTYLRTLIEYWRTKYNWRKYEQELNKYPNFKTNVEGLDIHFWHSKATISKMEDLQVIPILLIHGWPGSCYDYRKVIPLLTNSSPKCPYVFDVVCPSIPGFGFSESPHCKGFNAKTAARMFITLMDRLGYPRFYVQGCGWGSVVASVMARYYPDKIMGLHVSMCFSFMKTFDCTVKLFLMRYLPFLTSPEEYKMVFPFKEKLQTLLQETSLFRTQPTKPDTIGYAIADSPAGLLACILDKYSFDEDRKYEYLLDEELTQNPVQEILTITTIMWVNNNFAASSRFYKKNIEETWQGVHEKVPLRVPSAVAAFPNEPLLLPKLVMCDLFSDLVSYNVMPKGGRFCAAEEPDLLAGDVRKFVEAVEERPF